MNQKHNLKINPPAKNPVNNSQLGIQKMENLARKFRGEREKGHVNELRKTRMKMLENNLFLV